jgi:hypothetical protein
MWSLAVGLIERIRAGRSSPALRPDVLDLDFGRESLLGAIGFTIICSPSGAKSSELQLRAASQKLI